MLRQLMREVIELQHRFHHRDTGAGDLRIVGGHAEFVAGDGDLEWRDWNQGVPRQPYQDAAGAVGRCLHAQCPATASDDEITVELGPGSLGKRRDPKDRPLDQRVIGDH